MTIQFSLRVAVGPGQYITRELNIPLTQKKCNNNYDSNLVGEENTYK
jgi:hypothetical protein